MCIGKFAVQALFTLDIVYAVCMSFSSFLPLDLPVDRSAVFHFLLPTSGDASLAGAGLV